MISFLFNYVPNLKTASKSLRAYFPYLHTNVIVLCRICSFLVSRMLYGGLSLIRSYIVTRLWRDRKWSLLHEYKLNSHIYHIINNKYYKLVKWRELNQNHIVGYKKHESYPVLSNLGNIRQLDNWTGRNSTARLL